MIAHFKGTATPLSNGRNGKSAARRTRMLGALASLSLALSICPSADAANRSARTSASATAPSAADFCFLGNVCIGQPAKTLLQRDHRWVWTAQLDWVQQDTVQCSPAVQRIALDVRYPNSRVTYPVQVELYPTTTELSNGKLQWSIIGLSMLKPGNFTDEDVSSVISTVQNDKGPFVTEAAGLYQQEKMVHVAIRKAMSSAGGNAIAVDYRLDLTAETKAAVESAIRLQPACRSKDLPKL